jgi:hypothetical protein
MAFEVKEFSLMLSVKEANLPILEKTYIIEFFTYI